MNEASDVPAILLSAGVGITPMVSMFRHMINENIRTRNRRPVVMLNSFRHVKDQAFFEEINELAGSSEGAAQAYWLVTQPDTSSKQGIHYSAKGRLDKAKLQALLPIGRYEFYLCGPATFMQQTYDLLISLGVQDSDVFAETFGPASLKRTAPPGNDTSAEDWIAKEAVIEFSRSSVEQGWVKDDGNLLDFGESHGLTPAFGCRNGSCGSCKVKVTQGEVVHAKNASFPIEKNEALLCCAQPKMQDNADSVRIVLDA